MAKKGESGAPYAALLVCGGGFAVGCLFGCLAAGLLGESDRAALADYLAGYGVALSGGAGMPGLAPLLWNGLKWPGLAVLLGFTALGVAALPLAFVLRGFFLSYCVAGLIRALAGKGALVALVLFGVEGLFALPAFFVLGLQSWSSARGMEGRLVPNGRSLGLYGPGWWMRCFLCLALVALGAVAQWAALPPILRAAAPFLAGA